MKPIDLGVIGEAHVFTYLGGDFFATRYKLIESRSTAFPYLVEAAFAWRPDTDDRLMITGSQLVDRGRRQSVRRLGDDGEGLEAILGSSAPAPTSRSPSSCTSPARGWNFSIRASRA